MSRTRAHFSAERKFTKNSKMLRTGLLCCFCIYSSAFSELRSFSCAMVEAQKLTGPNSQSNR